MQGCIKRDWIVFIRINSINPLLLLNREIVYSATINKKIFSASLLLPFVQFLKYILKGIKRKLEFCIFNWSKLYLCLIRKKSVQIILSNYNFQDNFTFKSMSIKNTET